MTEEPSGVVTPEPDGQGAEGGVPAPEPSLDDVVYVAVVRSAAPKNGREVVAMMEAFRQMGVQPVTTPTVAAVAITESGSRQHDAMRALGFTFDEANRHFTVVSETPSDESGTE